MVKRETEAEEEELMLRSGFVENSQDLALLDHPLPCLRALLWGVPV